MINKGKRLISPPSPAESKTLNQPSRPPLINQKIETIHHVIDVFLCNGLDCAVFYVPANTV